MFERKYNEVVGYTLATTAEEIADVFARLAGSVANGLATELLVANDVHRYDVYAKRAYYLVMTGTQLAVWVWDHVYRPHEAGELIFLVVGSRESLDEKLANEFYTRATGRTVDRPWPILFGDEAAD
jgi:hypothetical protein